MSLSYMCFLFNHCLAGGAKREYLCYSTLHFCIRSTEESVVFLHLTVFLRSSAYRKFLIFTHAMRNDDLLTFWFSQAWSNFVGWRGS